MKANSIVFCVILSALGVARAGGIDWTYDGTFKYDKAIIVWTDERANRESCQVDVGIKWLKVKEMLETKSEGATVAEVVETCERKSLGDYIFATAVSLEQLPTRINNDLLYLGDAQGWGFSLFVNVDEKGFITNYAINELTEGMINSSTRDGATSLTIKDADIVQSVSSYGNKRLEDVGAPNIVPHGQAGRSTQSENPNAISFEIANAVNGFRYEVVESRDVKGPYVRNPELDLRAGVDGRLLFEIPINPNEKVMFYKVRVGGE